MSANILVAVFERLNNMLSLRRPFVVLLLFIFFIFVLYFAFRGGDNVWAANPYQIFFAWALYNNDADTPNLAHILNRITVPKGVMRLCQYLPKKALSAILRLLSLNLPALAYMSNFIAAAFEKNVTKDEKL